MAHLEYHNNIVDLTESFYQSHFDLIRNVCIELDQVDKIKELQDKFLNKLKLKAKKDPDRPKRARTSYIFFCDEMRKDKTGPASVAEQSKKFGALWQLIKDPEKKKYIEMADKDKLRYEEEMQSYSYA